MYSSFLTGLHPFSARKNKRRSLESLESGEKPNNPLVARYTDTLTTCSHRTVGTKREMNPLTEHFYVGSNDDQRLLQSLTNQNNSSV